MDGGQIVESPRPIDPHHPLLYGLATDRMILSQTSRLDAGGRLEPLLSGDYGPILLAGETSGRRVAAVAIRPDASGMLPLMASWPIFIGNLVYWGLGDEVGRDIAVNRAGDVVIAAEGDRLLWRGSPTDEPRSVALSDDVFELNQLGLWNLDDTRRGTANLASRGETMLPSVGVLETTATTADASEETSSGSLGELTAWFIAAVILSDPRELAVPSPRGVLI